MKEKLLLHTCCAPCSIYIISKLAQGYDLTVYYFNPNIFPEEEYLKRLAEVKEFCQRKKIKHIEADYTSKEWFKQIEGYEHEPERGQRCDLCFNYRLGNVAKYAKDNGFDWFTTSLTSGRQKNSFKVMEAARKAENKFEVKFLAIDFKKNFGTQINDWLSQQMDLYRQEYCGCLFSIRK